jgi:hypothetical protein
MAGTPWKSLKSAFKKAIWVDGFECFLRRLKRCLKKFNEIELLSFARARPHPDSSYTNADRGVGIKFDLIK